MDFLFHGQLSAPQIFEYNLPFLKGNHYRVKTVYWFSDAVTYSFNFRFERTKQLIPNDQNASVVLIDVLRVFAVMYSMMRRGVKDVFKWPQASYPLCMDEELQT